MFWFSSRNISAEKNMIYCKIRDFWDQIGLETSNGNFDECMLETVIMEMFENVSQQKLHEKGR